MYDEVIKVNAEKLFIKRNCDKSSNFVKAALLTTVSKMAKVSNIIEEEEVLAEMVNIYDVDDTTLSMVGMSYQFCFNFIGYDVDYENYAEVLIAYRLNKDNYDFLYKAIVANINERKNNELILKDV